MSAAEYRVILIRFGLDTVTEARLPDNFGVVPERWA